MKILKIEIENLGPYLGKHSMNFATENPDKNVVLIGGLNGAGKTTLFKSIQLGLYGCKAYGFDSENSKYQDIIRKLINASASIEKKGMAAVNISILMDDGKDDFVYSFERSWPIGTKTLHEKVRITRNGEELDEKEQSDFQSYLLQLIPPDLFRFYFFDGESIKGFVFNGVKNTDFKNAFLKLCGLDTMELIHESFQKISSGKKKGNSGTYEEYLEAVKHQKEAEQHKTELSERHEALLLRLATIDDEIAKAEKDFSLRGGITQEEYQSMLKQISKEESTRETTRKWLKEKANEILPFLIIKPELERLAKQIENEEKSRSAEAMLECISNPKIFGKLMEAFTEDGIDQPVMLSRRVIDVLKSSLNYDNNATILNLSRQEQIDVISKVNSVFAFNPQEIIRAAEDIDRSLSRVKKIRKKLEISDTSDAESYFAHKESLLKEKASALQEQIEIERDLESASQNLLTSIETVKKNRQKYEEYLKVVSVNDVSARAVLAFGDLQHRLYRKYIEQVENAFIESFSNLINKSDLLDGIHIDENLQVYPYKLQSFKRGDIISILTQYGANELIDRLGSSAYEAFCESSALEDPIILPVEVKQDLSAGEKQIFIMALYQALSTLNHVSVPYVIDTPFARIDTEHRQKILKNFFMRLQGQTIILSTDEEIVGPYKEILSDAISDMLLLEHSDRNGTRIIPGRYFEEE